MDIANGSSFIASITTIGRKSGKEHTVPLRVVSYSGKFYISRREGDSDWFKNIAKNDLVKIDIGGRVMNGRARIINDEALIRRISAIKYSDERSQRKRVMVEITLV